MLSVRLPAEGRDASGHTDVHGFDAVQEPSRGQQGVGLALYFGAEGRSGGERLFYKVNHSGCLRLL